MGCCVSLNRGALRIICGLVTLLGVCLLTMTGLEAHRAPVQLSGIGSLWFPAILAGFAALVTLHGVLGVLGATFDWPAPLYMVWWRPKEHTQGMQGEPVVISSSSVPPQASPTLTAPSPTPFSGR